MREINGRTAHFLQRNHMHALPVALIRERRVRADNPSGVADRVHGLVLACVRGHHDEARVLRQPVAQSGCPRPHHVDMKNAVEGKCGVAHPTRLPQSAQCGERRRCKPWFTKGGAFIELAGRFGRLVKYEHSVAVLEAHVLYVDERRLSNVHDEPALTVHDVRGEQRFSAAGRADEGDNLQSTRADTAQGLVDEPEGLALPAFVKAWRELAACKAVICAELAGQFMVELLNSVETLSGIAEVHGTCTLADLMYLHSAILSDSFIEHLSAMSKVVDIASALPSGERWATYIHPLKDCE